MGDPEVQVFRIRREWWGKFDRTSNEVLHKLGFVQLPDGGWACGKDTAQRVVNTVCAFSFGWDNDSQVSAPQEDEPR